MISPIWPPVTQHGLGDIIPLIARGEGARRGRVGEGRGDGVLEVAGHRVADAHPVLPGELAGAAHGLGLLASALLGRLLIGSATLHLAEHAFALQFLLKNANGLIDIVVAHENLHPCLQLCRMEGKRVRQSPTLRICAPR